MKGKDSPATQSATSQPIMLRGKSHNNISSICSSFLTGYMLNCIFAIGSFNPLGLVWVQGKVKTTKNRFNVCISNGGHVNFYHMTWNVFLLCFLIFLFICLSALWSFFWSMLLSLGHEKTSLQRTKLVSQCSDVMWHVCTSFNLNFKSVSTLNSWNIQGWKIVCIGFMSTICKH